MPQAVISFKTDSTIKKFYEDFAKSYGLTTSALLNIQMRQFLQNPVLTIDYDLVELDKSAVTPKMKEAKKKAQKTPKHLLHNI